MNFIVEQISNEKENYFLQKKDIAVLGNKEIYVKDDTNLYHVKIVNGNIESVALPDGEQKFEMDDINSQLNSGSTLGAAITGERLNENKLQKAIKLKIRKYLLL